MSDREPPESLARYAAVKNAVARAAKDCGRHPDDVTLIAVSKTFDGETIRPLLIAGHRVFGENRVQESQGKWPALKAEFSGVELHLIGPLQSNKVKEALALFDVIETVDRPSLAEALSKELQKTDRRPKFYIQVNTGEEPQKAGIIPKDADLFIEKCRNEWALEIVGLMCIPPIDEPPSPHFALLRTIAARHDLKTLSMGMSSDYEEAIQLGATHVRVGSAIFGTRS